MKMTLALILAALPIMCAAADNGQIGAPRVLYEFSSGGAYHPSGAGEWIVGFADGTTISIRHNVRGEITDWGDFGLTDTERARLTALFSSLDVAGMDSSTRPGMPDEVQYSFTLTDGSGTYSRSIWINDARDNPAAMELVDYLGMVIEKYTGIKPVMR